MLIGYAGIMAVVANGWYLDIIGALSSDKDFAAQFRVAHGHIGLYDFLVCALITGFYIIYVRYNYQSDKKENVGLISMTGNEQSHNSGTINNGVIINYGGKDAVIKLNSPHQDDLFDSVYIPYFSRIFEYIDLKDYSNWCYGLAVSGETCISRQQLSNLQKAAQYSSSRTTHAQYGKYDSLIQNLGMLLHDLTGLIELHTTETSDGMLRVNKFYKINVYDEQRYRYLHGMYMKYVWLIGDLTFELTRMVNYILDEVRSEKPSFLVDEGVATVHDVNELIEYSQEEKNGSPYPGIKEFVKVNRSRNPHYSSDFNYDVDIFSQV